MSIFGQLSAQKRTAKQKINEIMFREDLLKLEGRFTKTGGKI